MEAAELFECILARSADRDGILDRFTDNAALYADCFNDFLEEPNAALLEQSLAERDYARAFDAAHALKGLSANLGLTGYYEAICALVESLRAGAPGGVEREYAELRRQLELLRELAGADSAAPGSAAEPPKAPPTAPRTGASRAVILAAALLLCALLLVMLFTHTA